MELNKDRGPIYSRYDRDRSNNYSPVIDYAAPPRTSEEIQFILAHKITPTEADPNDMRPGASRTYQEGTTPLPAFLQSLSNSMQAVSMQAIKRYELPAFLQSPSNSMAQRTAEQPVDGQNKANQAPYWAGQRRNTTRTEAQSKAALVGIIIWVLFILLFLLMSLRVK